MGRLGYILINYINDALITFYDIFFEMTTVLNLSSYTVLLFFVNRMGKFLKSKML